MDFVEKLIKNINNVVFKNSVRKKILSIENNDISTKLLTYNGNRKFGYDKIFCYAPQNSLYFKFNGDVIACCVNNIDVYGNMMKNTLEEIWQSSLREKLKEVIGNYEYNKGCEFCYKQLNSKNFNGIHANLYDNYYNRYSSFKYPTDVTFEISNKCNLECIMCDGYRSSSIRKNREKLEDRLYLYPENFLEQLLPFIPHFRVVRLQGGEPLLIPFYLELIDKIVEINQKCKIYIQTNGTILSDRIRKILELKQIEISISIDAFNRDDYEFIRKNGNFEKVIKNTLIFNEIAKSKNKKLNINYCILKNNILKIHEAIEFCEQYHINIEFLVIDNPASMSILNTDKKKRNIINDYLNNCIDKFPKFKNILTDIKNYLQKGTITGYDNHSLPELYYEFYELNKRFIPFESINYNKLREKIESRLSSLNDNDKHYIMRCLLLDLVSIQNTAIIREGNLDEYLSVFFSRKDILLKL